MAIARWSAAVILNSRPDKHVEAKADGLKDKGSTPFASTILISKEVPDAGWKDDAPGDGGGVNPATNYAQPASGIQPTAGAGAGDIIALRDDGVKGVGFRAVPRVDIGARMTEVQRAERAVRFQRGADRFMRRFDMPVVVLPDV